MLYFPTGLCKVTGENILTISYDGPNTNKLYLTVNLKLSYILWHAVVLADVCKIYQVRTYIYLEIPLFRTDFSKMFLDHFGKKLCRLLPLQ